MKKIKIMGVDQFYFSKTEKLPEKLEVESIEYIVQTITKYILEQLPIAKDFRATLVPTHMDMKQALVYFLFAPNSADLSQLDKQIEQNKFQSGNIKNMIFTLYHETLCRHCNSWWHSLIAPTVGFAFTEDFIDLDQIEQFTIKCPKCDNIFPRLYVVKIFEEASPIDD
jgi:hypothetical protein